MKYWSFIFVELFVAIAEMILAGSILYVIITEGSTANPLMFIIWIPAIVLWVFLLAKNFTEMYEHLGDKNV